MRRGSISVVALTGVAQEIASPSASRKAISFNLSPAAGNTVVNNRSPANANDGFSIGLNNSPFVISDSIFGDLASGPWFAFSAAATGNVIIFDAQEI